MAQGDGGDPSDLDLLDAWRGGDRSAGDRLVRRYHGEVSRYFDNAVGDADRQDLVQETFRRLTMSKGGFQGQASFRTYLYAIATKALQDHLRKRYRKGDFDPMEHSVEDVDGATPSRAVSALRRTRKVLACLRGLPVMEKQILELYTWHGFTAKEVGEVFEIPEGTVRRKVHDARAELRSCMVAKSPGGGAEVEGDSIDVEKELEALREELAPYLEQGGG